MQRLPCQRLPRAARAAALSCFYALLNSIKSQTNPAVVRHLADSTCQSVTASQRQDAVELRFGRIRRKIGRNISEAPVPSKGATGLLLPGANSTCRSEKAGSECWCAHQRCSASSRGFEHSPGFLHREGCRQQHHSVTHPGNAPINQRAGTTRSSAIGCH